jgi:hypothetical protein
VPIAAAVLIIALITALLIKKRNYSKNIYPAGQMMVQIKNVETGVIEEPFYKDLSGLSHEFTIHDLLDLNPEYEETARVLLKAAKGDKLILINKSKCIIEAQGKEVKAEKGFTLKNNDKFEVVVQSKIISMKYYRWNSTIFVESLFQDIPDED